MKPFIIYMVGISGSGKTTIANMLCEELLSIGRHDVQLIDGDVIRSEFGDIFGYTYNERMRCNKAVCVTCKYLLVNNISVILAQVGAYQKMREQVKSVLPESYIEVYVKCSYEECAKRDVKGYYKKLAEGRMQNLNGANDLFEIPTDSDIVVDTERQTKEECVGLILECLKARGYLG